MAAAAPGAGESGQGGMWQQMGGQGGSAMVGGVGAGLLQMMGDLKSKQWSNQEQRQARDFAEGMASTAYQRMVADLTKAGLNPALAYVNAHPSQPGVTLPVTPDVGKGLAGAMTSSAKAAGEMATNLAINRAAVASAEANATTAKNTAKASFYLPGQAEATQAETWNRSASFLGDVTLKEAHRALYGAQAASESSYQHLQRSLTDLTQQQIGVGNPDLIRARALSDMYDSEWGRRALQAERVLEGAGGIMKNAIPNLRFFDQRRGVFRGGKMED